MGEQSTLSADMVKCSIPEAMLKSRTTKLEQYVNEARWRLQMVSPKLGVVQDGNASVSSTSSEDDDDLGLTESDEGEGTFVKGKKRRSRRSVPRAATTVVKADESERSASASSCSSSRVDSTQGVDPTLHPVSGSRPPSMGRKVSPIPTGPRAMSPLSSTQLAPRPVNFAAGSHSFSAAHTGLHSASHLSRSHSTRSSPKARSIFSKQNSASSLTSEPSNSGHNAPDNVAPQQQKAQLEGDSGGDADVEERSPVAHPKRRKRLRSHDQHMTHRRSHTHHHSLTGDSGRPRASRNSIICWMLVSADSLLRMCLKQSNYMRASEVLKTLHMEGQFGEALIRFSEQYEAVSRELVQQSRSNTPLVRRSSASASSSVTHSAHLSHSSTPPQPPSTGTPLGDHSHQPPSNMNLQVAILNAKSSFDPLQCVYQLLAPSSVYQVLFSGDKRLEALADESEPLKRMMSHVPSLVMLDLVCTNDMSGHIATKLLEVASDRLQSDQSAALDVDGPFVLLRFMASMSTHFPQSAGSFVQAQILPPPHASPYSLLTRSCHALTPSAVSQVRVSQETYRQARERLELEMDISREELEKVITAGSSDIFSQLIALSKGTPSHSPSSPLRHQTPGTASIFDELIRALHSVPSNLANRPSQENGGTLSPTHYHSMALNGSGEVSYLWKFSQYMSRLVELIVKCLNEKVSSESNTVTLNHTTKEGIDTGGEGGGGTSARKNSPPPPPFRPPSPRPLPPSPRPPSPPS
jgi:hypothetical protein